MTTFLRRHFILKAPSKLTVVLVAKSFGILMMLLSFKAYSQTDKLPPQFNTVSPNSIDLIEKRGTASSNLYNGSLAVNLPITAFNSRNVSIPIELFYNSNGIRIDQRPTSVGIGWNISLGGEITRIVRGYPDEKQATHLTDYRAPHYVTGGYFFAEIPSFEEPESYDGSYLALRNFMNSYGGNTQSFINNIIKPNYDYKIIDLAPDEFIVNLSGVSVSFYFSPDGGVKFKSKSGAQFKVEYTMSNNGYAEGVLMPRAIVSFKLTDNKGIQYFFGGTNAVEYSYPAQDVSQIAGSEGPTTEYLYTPGATINTWKLVKIIDVDKNQVNLEYKRKEQIVDRSFIDIVGKIGANDAFVNGYDVNSTRKAVTAVCLLDKIYDNIGNVLKCNYGISNSLGSVTTWGSSLSFRVSSTSINVAMGSAFQMCSAIPGLRSGTRTGDLSTQPQLFALKSIVKLYNDEQVDSIILNYRDEANKRLRLSSVSKSDQMGVTRTIYQFQYNATDLPEYTTKKDDFWGYYNGNNFFEYSVEPKNYTYNKISADFINSKQPNISYTGAELLEKIIFETKGYQKFEFEPNTCSMVFDYTNNQLSTLSNEAVSGGLRIKKIEEFDENNGLLTQKKYHYVKNFATNGTTSSGIQRWKTKNLSDYLRNWGDGLTWKFDLGSDYTRRGHDGNVVGYIEVTEENVGSGFKTFFFDDADTISIPTTGPVDGGWVIQELNNYYTLKYGLLRKEEYYNESKVKAYEKTYDYSVNDSEYLTSIAFAPPFSYSNWEGIYGDILRRWSSALPNQNYTNRIYLHNPLLIKTITKNFEGGGLIVTKEVDYAYNQNKLLAETTASSSIEDYTTKTSYAYSDQFALSGSAGTNIYSKMVAANMLNYPIETITSLKRLNQPSKVINSRLTIFNNNNDGNLILPEKELLFEPLDWYAPDTFITTQGNSTGITYDSRYNLKIKYNKYDWRGNLLEVQKESDKKNTYLYSYNGSYPVAEIVNADYASVETALGGPAAIANFSNSNPNDLYVTTFINSLRNSSTLKDAQISTRTYRFGAGVTSQTDPKRMSTYYEYDGFGRLKNIRDTKENIVKSFKYSTGSNSVYINIRPDWVNTGLNTQCETVNDTEYGNQLVNTGYVTIEQKDINPKSATYNQTRRVVDGNNTSVPCPANYYFTYNTDRYMASVNIKAKRSYDDNTTKTMRFRVRYDSFDTGSSVNEQIIDIVISAQNQNQGEESLFVFAVSYLEVELLEIF